MRLVRIGDDALTGDLVMDAPLIPLEMQRRFERRWAARFAAPVGHLSHPENHDPKIIISDSPPLVRRAAEGCYERRL